MRNFSLRKKAEEFVEVDRSIEEYQWIYKGIQYSFSCPVFSRLNPANFPSNSSLHIETMSASWKAETLRQLRTCCTKLRVTVPSMLLMIR